MGQMPTSRYSSGRMRSSSSMPIDLPYSFSTSTPGIFSSYQQAARLFQVAGQSLAWSPGRSFWSSPLPAVQPSDTLPHAHRTQIKRSPCSTRPFEPAGLSPGVERRKRRPAPPPAFDGVHWKNRFQHPLETSPRSHLPPPTRTKACSASRKSRWEEERGFPPWRLFA